MNYLLLEKPVQDYIKDHEKTDPGKVSLQKPPFENVSSSELAQQVKGRQITKIKFPFLHESENIYFPPSVNMEQASSIYTAGYKAGLLKNIGNIIDLTGGFGIDAYAFAQQAKQVYHVERNASLSQIAQHNFRQLKIKNVDFFSGDYQLFLEQNPDLNFDCIYLDPSRRDQHSRKVKLDNLEPDIIQILPELLTKSNRILVKLSPLTDIKLVINELPYCKEIHLVAVKNEMKDFLVLIEKYFDKEAQIHAVNLLSGNDELTFKLTNEENARSRFSGPEHYIYEPNAAILKSGAFKLLGEKYNLKKLHVNTHLYTSTEIISNFPGKIFKVLELISDIRKSIQKGKFNVICKNYPMKPEEIRKKYKINDGGSRFLLFTESTAGKHCVLMIQDNY